MKRIPTRELLDTDSGTPAEIAASLADLRRVNRWFGGVSTTQWMIELVSEAIGKSSLSLLEVAAGSGDVPRMVRERLQQRGITLEITLLDRAPSHIRDHTRALSADALAIPFREASFDLVGCGLFAHHLNPAEFVQFVQEALRVCRIAVLINDLVRDPIHLVMVYAGYPLYHSRLTRHDAPASVRQAYTPEEMRKMLRQTGAARVEISRHYLFRMGAIAWKV